MNIISAVLLHVVDSDMNTVVLLLMSFSNNPLIR